MFNFKSVVVFLSMVCLSGNLFADETMGQTVMDTAITAKVKASLVADSDVSSLGVSVETNNSVVTLTGCADTQAQIDKVEKDTKETSDVKSVVNKLTICKKQ